MRKLIILAACSAVAACEKPTAKFHPGDKVMVKLTQQKGVIWTRLSPFSEDQYYVRVPAEKMPRADLLAIWPKWRAVGPYYDTELVLSE